MTTKVLHGEGEPRIIIIDDTNKITTVVAAVNKKIVTLESSITLNATVLNRQFVSKNADDAETKGRIIKYDNAAHTIEVDFYDNERPVADKAVTITNSVIDLPFCQNNLIETFEVDYYPVQKLFNSGKKIIRIKGFYYSVILDYSRLADLSMLQSMQPVYNSTRTAAFLFYPRKDNRLINYECEIDPEHVLQIAQNKHHYGHKLVVFKFIGINRISKPELIISLKDVNNYGYGSAFGKSYGKTGW